MGLDRGASLFPAACGVKTGFAATGPLATGLTEARVPMTGTPEKTVLGTTGPETGRTTVPAEVGETSPGRSDRWAVVLLNDNYHSTDYVVWALLKTVPELSQTDAALIMLEAHNTGKGVVTLCGRAQAEEYRAALRLLQLGREIEPGW